MNSEPDEQEPRSEYLHCIVFHGEPWINADELFDYLYELAKLTKDISGDENVIACLYALSQVILDLSSDTMVFSPDLNDFLDEKSVADLVNAYKKAEEINE